MSDTTDMEKLRILTMWECGKSTAEIAKSVNKSARTVQRWLAHQKREGNMQKKPRGLRPRKTTPEEDAKIIQLVRENPELTQKEILTICNLNIYKGTLRKRIQEANGIYKIDLFADSKAKGGQKSPKKRGKTKKLNENDTITPPTLKTEITEIKETKDELPLLTQPVAEVEPTTKVLLDILMSPQADHFDTTEVNVEDNLFAITENTMESTQVYAKDEILPTNTHDSNNMHDLSDSSLPKSETIIPDELSNEITVDHHDFIQNEDEHDQQQQNQQHLEVVIQVNEEEQLKFHKKRGPKTKILHSQEQNNVTTQTPVDDDCINTRKRRPKVEVNYVEEQEEDDKKSVCDVEVKEQPKKRGRKRKNVADESDYKLEKEKEKTTAKRAKRKMPKEKTQWEKDRKDTTDIEKKKILIMAECGMTTEDIARSLKKSRRTVQRWLSKHSKGLNLDKKERGRRPRKTTPEEDARIIQLVKENPHLSRKEILNLANINLHKVTLKNRLNEAGMFFNSQGVKILDFTDQNSNQTVDKQSINRPKYEVLNLYLNVNSVKDERDRDRKMQHFVGHDINIDNDRDNEANTIITCSSLTPTPAITNAILTCPTLSTTLIITNPGENGENNQSIEYVNVNEAHGEDGGGGNYQDYNLY